MAIFEYRTFRIARGAWPRLPEEMFGHVDESTRAAGGSVFLLCAGLIGFASDEGVLVRSWPERDDVPPDATRSLARADMIIESNFESLVATARPRDGGASPRAPGVYAHRWFWLNPEHWDEFERLSEDGIWPFFESDGCEIVGLWRAPEENSRFGALLVTRYENVAHWETDEAAIFRSAIRRRSGAVSSCARGGASAQPNHGAQHRPPDACRAAASDVKHDLADRITCNA